jgi:hypothetical protein
MANIFDDMPISGAEPAAPPPSEKTPPSEKAAPERKANIFDAMPSSTAELSPPVSSWESSKAGRFVQGLAEPIVGAGQLAAHLTGIGPETMDRIVKEREAKYQASRKAAGIGPQDWDYMAGLGNIASPINYLPGAAAGRLMGAAGRAATLGTRIGEGAMAGAAQGAFTPVGDTSQGDFAEKKTTQAGLGALAGGAGAPLAASVSGAIAPGITPEVRQLLHEGVELTPGQTAGGFLKYLEDIGAGTPFISGPIQAARQRSLETFNQAAANRALAPIGEQVPQGLRTGHDLAAFVEERLGLAYQRVHSATQLGIDPALRNDLLRIGQRYQTLGADRSAQLQAIIDENLERLDAAHNGAIPGNVVHGGMANIRRLSGNLHADRDAFNRELGNALEEVHGAMEFALERQNPGFLQELQNTNRGWANYVRLRQAAASGPAQAHEGTFLPSQLGSATRQLDRTAGKGASARGTALMQDLVEAGRSTMPSKVPNSGTAERAATMALLGGHMALSPQTAVLSALIPGLYSRPGVRIARQLLTANRPQAVQALGQGLDVLGSRAAAEGALSSFDTTPRQYADGGGIGEGLDALGRIPGDLKRYADDLPEADTSDNPSLVSRAVDGANYGVNALVEGLSGGRASTPKILGALGLPTGELEQRLDGFAARNRPMLQVGRDIGAAGLGAAGSGAPEAFGKGAPNMLAKTVEPGGLADKAAGAFERGAKDAGNPYRLNAGIPGKGAPLTPEQEALLAKFKRPTQATPDELAAVEPKGKTPLKDGKAADGVDGAAAPSTGFGPGTAVRFVHPDSHLAQAYENELISGQELFTRTKQAVSGLKAVAEKLAGNASGRMSVHDFQEWANQRHNPFSDDPRESRMKFSIQDAEDAGFVHAYTEGGHEIVEITPLGYRTIEHFKKSGM